MTVPPSYKRRGTNNPCPKGRNFPCPKNSLPFSHGLWSESFFFFAFGFSWGIVGNSEKIPVKNWDGISDSTCSFPCSLQ